MAETETQERPSSADLRAKAEEHGDKLRELRDLAPDKRGDGYEADVRDAIRSIRSLDSELGVAEARERAERIESERQRPESRGPDAAGAHVGPDGLDMRSLGEQVESSDAYREWAEGPNHDWRSFPNIELRTLITSSTSDTPAAGVLRPAGQPIPPIPQHRRLFVRDLLASGTTNLASIPYIRELIPATNETGASAVAEGVAKPEAVMSFVAVDAPVRKIAAWVPATEEILADAPTLRSYIDNRLVYMVQVREELDLLKGVNSGANPTVEGIFNVTGHGTQTPLQSNSVDDYIRTLGVAIGKVEAVDGFATGIAMNPTDYWTAITTRWGTAGGQFDSGSPFVGPPGTIWGLPVVRTRSLAASEAVVADWQRGGQVFQRSGISVRTSDSHSDYFVLNKIALLAEERIAFAIYRPDWFIVVDLST